MHDIKTFEDACKKKGVGTQLPDVSTWPPYLRRTMLAFYKLSIIRDAIVGDWVPDWNNGNQRKWNPWFWMNQPGFRLLAIDYVISNALTSGGSRLCYETEEQARYAATTFLSLYEEFMTIMPDLDVSDSSRIGSIAPDQSNFGTNENDAALRKYALELAIGTGEGRIVERAEEYYKFLTAA